MHALDRRDALRLALYSHKTLHVLPDLLDLVWFYSDERDDSDEVSLRLIRACLKVMIYFVIFIAVFGLRSLWVNLVNMTELLILWLSLILLDLFSSRIGDWLGGHRELIKNQITLL